MNICKWCGEKANYYFKTTGNWCCSKYVSQCKEFKKTISDSHKGLKHTYETKKKMSKSSLGTSVKPKAILYENINNDLCEYGCGKIAKYKFSNEKICCEDDYRKCEFIINKRSSNLKNNNYSEATLFENYNDKLCNYGCGKIAKYKFDNDKLCCSSHILKCSNVRVMNDDIRKRLSKLNKKDIKYYKLKYPILSKVEELREHPKTKEIQGRCKNHKCKNSKEQNGWFTPTYQQIYERMRQLEHPQGNDGSYFYCCDECKQECPLFNIKPTSIINQNNLSDEFIYTAEEYKTWRIEVLKRNKHLCEYCGRPASHVHHIRPQKLEPFYSLDPDFGIACCESCHFKYGHKDECSTGNLANTVCN